MNIGKNISELRKNRGVKQEDLAAELGVTAAAVSKWENGYTLPDLYMLCALADYFNVTTDELLGRNSAGNLAVICAETEELGNKIADLARRYGIGVKEVHTATEAASASAKADAKVTHLLLAYSTGTWNSDTSLDLGRPISMYLNINDSEKELLHEVEEYLKENR